ALHAVHPVLNDGMMLWQVEFRVCFKVALKTRGRVLARIDNQPGASAAGFDVFASRPVTGFATGRPRPFQIVPVKPAVWTSGKLARDLGVAVRAHLVADVMRAFDLR